MLFASRGAGARLFPKRPSIPLRLITRSNSSVKTASSNMRDASSTPVGGVKVAKEIAEEIRQETKGRVQLDSDAWREAGAAETEEEATVWYFAFGSNMAKEVLTGRRMVKPAESCPAVLHGYRLAFNMPGIPYREPAFAGVERVHGPAASLAQASTKQQAAAVVTGQGGPPALECHGVVHRITLKQWQHVKATEGAAGHSQFGYAVEDVVVHTYDGRQLQAFTLVCQPKSVAFLKGQEALPSERYLTLLQVGAKEHGLSAAYQDYLGQLRHYTAETFGKRAGGLLMAGVFLGLVAPVFLAQRLVAKATDMSSSASGGMGGRLVASYLHTVFGLAWGLHSVVEPLLGSGCSNGSK